MAGQALIRMGYTVGFEFPHPKLRSAWTIRCCGRTTKTVVNEVDTIVERKLEIYTRNCFVPGVHPIPPSCPSVLDLEGPGISGPSNQNDVGLLFSE